ncbi:aldehyde dehydrogenase (NADP(+)) [Gryllotalpicola reticulitermitis]|uniref:Aldehyde dehydrogenase (NADP(+)) n=1 Tax=Gryllotalpicola reticulitermitis TaxID=1184153 RepID=A0ABV8Q526_9MICO
MPSSSDTEFAAAPEAPADRTAADQPRTLDSVVTAAQAAFESARDVAPTIRAAWLDALAGALEANAEQLVALAHDETHLPVGRLQGELVRTAFQLRLLGADAAGGEPLGATIDHADANWGMGPRPDIRRVAEPIGVVGVFGASNFPFAFSVLGGDSAAALAAGCAVVHKAHPAHARLARETARIAVDALALAGAPDGLFALVEGYDDGPALVSHPLVKAIGFTGSTRGGLALAALAADRAEPIPFYGELGSTNPVFVTPGAWAARRDAIVAGFVGSFTLGMGQFCTKPGYLVVPAGERDALVSELTDASPVTPHEMLSPSLRKSFERSLAEIEDVDGVEVLLTLPGADNAPPATVLRTSAATVLVKPELLEHEVFGPASVVIEYDDPAQLVQLAEHIGGQLTAGIHAEDGDTSTETGALLRALAAHAGRVLWNGWPTGVTVSYAQQHGGPYPATTAPATTSVGTAAITRFLRPVAYQDVPDAALPAPLQDANPWGITRRVDGVVTLA